MSRPKCAEPVPWGALVDWWLGDDLPAVEEHLFECGECAARAERIAGLGEGIRHAVASARLRGPTSRSVLDRLLRAGANIRSYRAVPGGTVHCTVLAEDDLVAIEFTGDLGGAPRLDLVLAEPGGKVLERFEDVPVFGGREVVFAEAGEILRPLPAGRMEVRLVAPSAEGDRVVAEYLLDHTPFRG